MKDNANLKWNFTVTSLPSPLLLVHAAIFNNLAETSGVSAHVQGILVCAQRCR